MQIIRLEEAAEKELLFEMVNIKSYRTGLPYDLWLDSEGSARKTQHNLPRVKVNVDGNLIPIQLTEEPIIPSSVKGVTDFRHKSIVLRYLKAYRDILLAHFNNSIDDADVIALLGPLTKAKEKTELLSDLMITTPQCVATFRYNVDELLYEIELTNKGQLIAVAYELNLSDVISKIDEWKQEFNIISIVDEDKLVPEVKLSYEDA